MASAPRPVALVGTTASGKSALALAAARALGDVEIVSVDSMQVYRGMDIGTAKPTPAEQAEVPHHLIDVADPAVPFDVSTFRDLVDEALAGIAARGHRALLVGGTGLYHRAVIDDLALPGRYPEVMAQLEAEPDTVALHARLAELDPLAAERMRPNNRRRVLRALEVTIGSGVAFSASGPGLERYDESRVTLVGLWLAPDVTRRRIAERYRQQMEGGFLDEVRALAAAPGGFGTTAAQALGYRELLAHLGGELSLDEAVQQAIFRTRQFARRQRRWFGRDPRISWVGAVDDPLVALPWLIQALDASASPPKAAAGPAAPAGTLQG